MPCRQVSTYNGKTGSGKTGGGGHTTEAECLAACQEGACCEGTSCSVKPACQCQGAGKVFKGVGTVCSDGFCNLCNPDGSPKPPYLVQPCWCFCGEGLASYPRFINLSLSITYKQVRSINGANQVRTQLLTTNVTLSAKSQSSSSNCPYWSYGEGGHYFIGSQYILPTYLPIGGGVGAVELQNTFESYTSSRFLVKLVFINNETGQSDPFANWSTTSSGTGYSDTYNPLATSTGVQRSGTCFSDITGASFSRTMPLGVTSGTFPIVPGESNMSWSGSIIGVQA